MDKSESEGRRGPMDPLTRRVLHVGEAAGAFIEWWGFKAIQARIWTLLALRLEPMTQVEIARTLSVSRSLVSTTMNELVKLGLVRPTEDKRNAPYEAVIDVLPVITDILRTREWMMIEGAKVALEAAIEEAELARDRGEAPVYDVARMRRLLAMTEMAQSFLKIIVALRVPQTVEGISGWIGKASKLLRSFRGR